MGVTAMPLLTVGDGTKLNLVSAEVRVSAGRTP